MTTSKNQSSKPVSSHTARRLARRVSLPSICFVTTTILVAAGYLLLIIGDLPEDGVSQGKFRVGFSSSTTPELEVTAYQLSVSNLTRSQHGILNLAWQSPVPVNGMVFFMIPREMEFHFARTGTGNRTSTGDSIYRQVNPGGGLSENDTFYKLPGIDYAWYYDIDEELNGVLYATDEYGDKAIGLPLRQPAGERELSVFSGEIYPNSKLVRGGVDISYFS